MIYKGIFLLVVKVASCESELMMTSPDGFCCEPCKVKVLSAAKGSNPIKLINHFVKLNLNKTWILIDVYR